MSTAREHPLHRVARGVAALAVALACAAGPARAQELDRAQRWEQMDEARRAQLLERFETWKRLAPEERERLEERALHLDRLRERLRERLPEERRAELERLPFEERREVLRQHLIDRLELRSEELREKLPAPFLRELEGAPPHERPRLLDAFRARLRDDALGGRGLERAAEELGLPPHELDRLRELRPAERLDELMRLRKETLMARLQQGGAGQGLSPEEWSSLSPLPPRRFLEELLLRDLSGSPIRGLDAERPLHRRVDDALRPRLEDLVESRGLIPSARRVFLAERSRARLLELGVGEGLLTPGERAALEVLNPFELRRLLIERVRLDDPDATGGRGPRGTPPPDGASKRERRL